MGFDLLALTLTNALYCMADSRVPGSSCVKPPGTRNTILFDISLATIELSENAQIPSSVGGGRRGVNKTGIRCAWLFWNLLEKAHEALLNAKEIYPCIFHRLVGKKSDLDLAFKKKLILERKIIILWFQGKYGTYLNRMCLRVPKL